MGYGRRFVFIQLLSSKQIKMSCNNLFNVIFNYKYNYD